MTYSHLTDTIPCKTHRFYRLTCDQYEGLLAESGGGCQICGFPAERMPQLKLYIDHVGVMPAWTVRGLLCIRCNSRLERGIPYNESAAEYLKNAWYLRQCAARGVPPDGGPEPDVCVLKDLFSGRLWTRLDGLWHPSDKRTFPRTWPRLSYAYGPFDLIPISE